MSTRTYSYKAATCDLCGATEIEPKGWFMFDNVGCQHSYAGYCTDMVESLSFCSRACAKAAYERLFAIVPLDIENQRRSIDYRPTWVAGR